MSTTIMCGLLAVAFTFKTDQITWFWDESKPVGVILIVLTIIFGLQWARQQKFLNKAKNTHETK